MAKIKGVSGGIRILKPTKQFKQALTLKQVGAQPVRTKRGVYWQVGGGLFTKKQTLASRQRYGRVMYGMKSKKADFGI